MRILFLSALISLSALLNARLPDLIPYRKGDHWGYADSTRKIILDTLYDRADFFRFGKAVVKKNRKCGVIDANGKTVIPFLYIDIKAGLISGYWSACLFGKYGVIDSASKPTIPALYDRIDWSGGQYVAARKAQQTSILNVTGTSVYTYTCLDIDWPPVFVPEANGFIIFMNGKCGVIDMNGKIRIPFRYDEIHYSPCGCFVGESNHKKIAFTKKGRKKRKLPAGCAAYETRTLKYAFVPACLDSVRTPTDTSTIKEDCGWKNPDGNGWAMMPKYQATTHFSYNMGAFMSHGLWGMVDTTFNVIIEPKYQILQVVDYNFAMAMNRPYFSFKDQHRYVYFLGYVDVHGTEYWEE